MSSVADERIRQLADRAQTLSKLKEHPSWDALRLELNLVRSNYMSRLTRRMVSGGISAPPFDQRELDYQRGFFAGAEWILQNPEKAESTLEQALAKGTHA